MPGGERILTPSRIPSDAAWLGNTCTLGFPLMGMWPPDSAAAVNSAHISTRSGGAAGVDSGLLLTAGDAGDIRLFNSPCVVAAAPCRDGRAHVGRVSSVRFLAGGASSAVSAGETDRVVVRWVLA